jgi:hypothetical protein
MLPDRRWGTKLGREHLPLGELAQPDRIQRVGLGPSREVLGRHGRLPARPRTRGLPAGSRGPFQSSLVASITTRVTPSSASRSAMTSSQRVIVW